MPISDKDLRAMVREFNTDHRLLLSTDDGSALQQQVRELSRELEAPDFNLGARIIGGAGTALPKKYGSAIDWMLLLPEPLRDVREAPLPEIDKFDPPTRTKVIGDGLRVLTLGAQTLVAGGGVGKPDFVKQSPAAIVQVAFGSDSISKKLRMNLVGPKAPTWPDVPELDSAKLQNLLRSGALHKLLRRFAECGYAAQLDRDWVAQVRPIGRVVALVPDRVCAGHSLTVRFEALGPVPPPDILLAVPTRTSCTHFRFGSVAPHLLDPARWTGSGEITVTLPEDVASGAVGFFSLPSPQPQTGPCAVGDLLAAAGEWQHILADQFEEAGIQAGTQVVNVATAVEAGRMRPLPCALPQEPGRENILRAGPPQIQQFRSDEVGPIHPRGSLTLRWSVSNATHVEIVAEDIPGTEHPHELPAIVGPQAVRGSLRLTIPCTRRWEGRYRLIAHNANGCSMQPVQSELDLRSGFSHYCLGVARCDVTDYRRDLPMAGFAYERQRTDGVDMPLYARAFVIRENRSGGRSLTLVVADIWTCTQIVKREVLMRLNYGLAKNSWRYTDENLLIAGTHTHAGPGGYSEYFLYNLTIGGFDQGVFDIIVNGIVQAVQSANLNARPGRLFVNAGELEGCGANRSFEAFQRNPEYNPNDPGSWTDREMLLLGFWVDDNNRGARTPLGLLNWYAIHPTALGMFNNKVSGDCKGHAELLAEAHFDGQLGLHGVFVAAFGNGNAGDVSGNVQLDALGNKTVERPMGGDVPAAPLTILPAPRHPSNRAQDIKRMQRLGEQQFERARNLFETASHELTGPLRCGHMFVDMSSVDIDARPGARTTAAALGVSFGAGSSEDSIAYATQGLFDIDAAILEGMNTTEMTASGVAFWASAALLLGPRLPLFVSAITGATPLVPLVVTTLLSTLATLPLLPPGPRSYGAALVGTGQFDSTVKKSPPQEDVQKGRWEWMPPPAPSSALRAAHGDKPIMFDVGNWKLKFIPGPQPARQAGEEACPLVPHVLPLQIMSIGSVVIAGVPAEFNGMAGRRLKQTLRTAFGPALSHVAISNYSNGYSGYVSTREEYAAQHYEGASTLYGPATLEAYQQCFDALARRVQGDPVVPISGEVAEGFVAPAVYRRI